jgi:predicted nuclease of predicted toxin-antitoxin system
MRFLLDEKVSYRVCPHLKAAGHDAVHVAEIGLTSADDQVILGCARNQDRVLVSCDHDFVQLLFASGDTRPSVILVREVDALPSAEFAALLLAALPGELTELLLAGAIATLTPGPCQSPATPTAPPHRNVTSPCRGRSGTPGHLGQLSLTPFR